MNQTPSFMLETREWLILLLVFVLVVPRPGWIWRWKHAGPVLLNLERYQNNGAGLGSLLLFFYIDVISRSDKTAILPWWYVPFLCPAVILVFLFELYLPLLVTEKGFLFRNHLISWDQIKTYYLAGDHTCILEIKKLPQYRFDKIVVNIPPGRMQPLQEILSSRLAITEDSQSRCIVGE
jgi:uncharacterized membrane protein YobD (UPF0266 family)